jgi:hypothetical protein
MLPTLGLVLFLVNGTARYAIPALHCLLRLYVLVQVMLRMILAYARGRGSMGFGRGYVTILTLHGLYLRALLSRRATMASQLSSRSNPHCST